MNRPEPEARMVFWSLAYLLRFQKFGDVHKAAELADQSLAEWDRKAEELGVGKPVDQDG